MNQPLANAQRIVVKIGSALLVNAGNGHLRGDWLASLCADIADLKKSGKDIVIVSSGAIALGRRALGLKAGTLKLEDSQAAAAVGQVQLAKSYAECLSAHTITAAQILLTLGDTEERRRYLNARATLKTLLAMGAVPVINENDTVATAEIRYGDNDRLAARVSSMMGADVLVLLSDIDGLYSANPSQDKNAEHISEVHTITPAIEAMAGDSISGVGRGGMASKLIAAKIATQAGATVIIAKGAIAYPLTALSNGARCTHFLASGTPAASRKRWIAGGLKPQGVLTIDDGAAHALRSGKSLLPAGITAVSGAFERGDAVRVCDTKGDELARGLAAYGADDAARIAGRRSTEIETLLGYRGRDEMIHRDDMALTANSESVGAS